MAWSGLHLPFTSQHHAFSYPPLNSRRGWFAIGGVKSGEIAEDEKPK